MRGRLHSVREYGSIAVGSSGLDTPTADRLSKAARAHARRLRLGPEDVLSRGHHCLKAGQVCGLIAVPGATVEILPKISLDRIGGRLTLIRMLSIAEDLRVSDDELADMQDEQNDLLELVLRLFSKRVLAALRTGLPRAYLRHEEDLALLRGSIDTVRQLTRHAARPDRLACRFDELSPDIPLNRLIKAALKTGGRLSRRDTSHHLFNEALSHYDEVADSHRPLDLTVRLDRSSSAWTEVLPLARLLLRASYQGTHDGTGRGFALLFPMNDLFEKYIGRLAQLTFGTAATPQDRSHTVTTCHRFQLIPDLVVELPNRTVIFDTKWKAIDPAHRRLDVAPADVYQMLAYGHAYRRPNREIRLVLLYPAVSGLSGPQASWRVQGSDLPLEVVTLNVPDKASIRRTLVAAANRERSSAGTRARMTDSFSPVV